jgi:hypothetical protein
MPKDEFKKFCKMLWFFIIFWKVEV